MGLPCITSRLWRGGSFAANAASPAVAVTVTRESDLVGWWKLDETSGTTVSDSSDTANDGAADNMTDADWVEGKNGNALDFDGTNDSVIIGSDSDYPTGDFSVSMWVYRVSGYPVFPPIMQSQRYYQAGYNGNWTFRTQASKLEFYAYNGTGAIGNKSVAITMNDDTWYHVGFVFSDSGNTIELYLDGSSLGTGAISGTLDDAAASGVYVGRDRTSFYWKGKIDDVRIYNVALSDSNMSDIHGSGDGDWS